MHLYNKNNGKWLKITNLFLLVVLVHNQEVSAYSINKYNFQKNGVNL
jgi:hypothetical protein